MPPNRNHRAETTLHATEVDALTAGRREGIVLQVEMLVVETRA
jgi:hypothetical protein